MTNPNEKFEWTEVDQRAVDTARLLAADAVEKVGSGHPGTAMSLAPVAYLLFQKVMNQDPNDDRWEGRDRFIPRSHIADSLHPIIYGWVWS